MEELQDSQSFFLVWSPSTERTAKKHLLLDNAQREAIRLTRLNPNITYYVLQAVDSYIVSPNPMKHCSLTTY